MKALTPSVVRLESDIYRDAESVLDAGESLTAFVGACVRREVAWRRTQDAFLTRSRDAIERGVREGGGFTPEELLRRMDERIDAAEKAFRS